MLVAIWLGAASAVQAQASCASANQPACSFLAIDVATGQPVDAFCVGRRVRFQQCAGRNIPTSLLFYGVLPGSGTTFLPSCSPPNPYNYEYTPTKAQVGLVTVSELANAVAGGSGQASTYYIRTFRVYDPTPPAFTVAPCPSNSALITVTDAAYDSYTVRVGNAPERVILRNQATVVAVPAGATTVTVTGRYAATGVCDGAATQPIAPLLPPQTPALTRLTLQAPLPGSAATLDVAQLPAGYTYTLQRADASVAGSYRAIANIPPNSTSFSLANAVAGCYRLRRTDPCRLDSSFSPLVCTLSLTGSSTQNRNQLLLNDAGRGNRYSVTRNGQPLAVFTPIAGGLEDPNVECGTTYTYRVTATQPGGGVSVSNPVSITTQSALPPAQPRLVASFNLRNVVELTPFLANGNPLATGSTLRYQRSTAGGPPAAFRTASSTGIQRDSVALAALITQAPCYTVRLVDVCGNTSPESSPSCPALLTAAPADPTGATASLTWTPFTGPTPGAAATFTLQRLASDGTVLSAVQVSGSSYTDLTPPTDRQILRYRLQIGGAGLPPGTLSYSNVATVTRQVYLNIATAFTPNGDRLNDVLEVKGRYLQRFTFVVIDRNGQEIFRSTQRDEAWDGTIKGRAPVLGTYAWRFQQIGEDGAAFSATGSVTILK
ncbi:gliding motility-associated C-terminal domain-containing protein [Hymenobacter sp. BT683]|uniref:Gliding motility-associated C-terminal domain-containing protein n=1 Tax=Hymenobacter jeongseonensis TaxID=2791027 RepID=A0ABS0IHU3_9BACT|nr:gliding motility-associated C-terminal domain-containing protein [Hymenobacter jeongseonensis]MBF9237488.1 gliding motility-associated C-terminal domain-containing protein [Hymenobacter jeongseonensis]